jgi:hypothetical protein
MYVAKLAAVKDHIKKGKQSKLEQFDTNIQKVSRCSICTIPMGDYAMNRESRLGGSNETLAW